MNVKKLEVNLDYKNIETVSIDYDKDALVKMMKEYGEKPLGGFTVDDPIEQAFLFGARAATSLIKTALNHLNDQEEE